MKMDTNHGEARLIIVGQLQATIDMLLRVQQPAEDGLKKQVYEGVDFDLIRRLQDNIEAWANEP